LSARGTNIFRGERWSGDSDFDRHAVIVWFLPKNTIILLKEEGENRCGYVQGWGENNANVAYSHLVGVCVVDDVDEETGKVS